MPHRRSGHSCCVHGDKLYIFGGIFELMKESNDMVIFNAKTKKFAIPEPAYEPNSPEKSKYAADQSSTHGDMSPMKVDKSPNKRRTTALYT